MIAGGVQAGVVAIGVGGTGGCVPSADVVERAMIDSLGVDIVTTADTTLSVRWTVAAEPFLRVGSSDPNEAGLFNAAAAMLRADRLIVANNGTYEILVFDRTATLRRRLGGRGSGPGEFETLIGVAGYRGDSIIGFEASGRLTVFDESGELGRTGRLWSSNYTFGQQPVVLSSFSNGELVGVAVDNRMSGVPLSVRENGPYRPKIAVVVATPDGEVYRQLFAGRSQEVVFFNHEDLNVTIPAFRPPFPASTFLAVHGAELLVGANDANTVSTFGSGGELRRRVHLSRGPVPIVDSDIESIEQAYLTSIPSGPRRTAFREMWDGLVIAAETPGFADMKLDATGLIWLRQWRRPFLTTRDWVVYSSDGEALARVTTPVGLRVDQIGEDFVVGHRRDAAGNEFVEAYSVARSVGGQNKDEP